MVALRRPRSLVEWAGPASVAGLAVASQWVRVTTALDWHPACVLRTRLGIPCPFCGGTTAAMRLAARDVAGALTNSPLAVALALIGLVGLVVYVLRSVGVLGEPATWSVRSQRLAAAAMALALAGSWAYQAARLGIT